MQFTSWLTNHPAVGVSAIGCYIVFVYYDNILRKAKQQNKPWAQTEEYRRLPLACLGGPSYVIGLFWLGWSARAEVHWIVPMLSGLCTGFGALLLFMALLNYLTDAYEVFSASAMAASSFSRSIFGTCLPLAAKPMYARLGVPWASSTLAFITLLMSFIPFVFIKYGDKIRANSKFCQEIKRRKMVDEQARLQRHEQQQSAREKDDVEA